MAAMAAIACSYKTTPAGSQRASDIVILYDNDVHCSVDGYAKMAAGCRQASFYNYKQWPPWRPLLK